MVSPSQKLIRIFIELMERRRLPDTIIRWGIRRILQHRIRAFEKIGPAKQAESKQVFLAMMRNAPIAFTPKRANEQYYELPAEFFELALGPRRKYSCCHYPAPETDLAQAEDNALAIACAHAELRDGMKILELGCGWGSLTLWMADHFPSSSITAVSNSHSQRQYIEQRCKELAFNNVEVITADMNDFIPPETDYDRVVSVEIFEHMRNWPTLLRRIASWLSPDGRLFVHIFCHRAFAYAFETDNESDWMGREFFTGGMMPSDDLMLLCQEDLIVEKQWRLEGLHYHKTCEAWLANMDKRRSEALALFESVYGKRDAARWIQRWRVFFMACSELFRFNQGCEWRVAHYALRKRDG